MKVPGDGSFPEKTAGPATGGPGQYPCLLLSARPLQGPQPLDHGVCVGDLCLGSGNVEATQARPQPPCSKTQEEDPEMSGCSS